MDMQLLRVDEYDEVTDLERAGALASTVKSGAYESYFVGFVRLDRSAKWTYEDGPMNKKIEECLLVKNLPGDCGVLRHLEDKWRIVPGPCELKLGFICEQRARTPDCKGDHMEIASMGVEWGKDRLLKDFLACTRVKPE